MLLELGGKCPAIVGDGTAVADACKRIAWGKWTMNMGQTCVSPDYVLTTKELEPAVVVRALRGAALRSRRRCRPRARRLR